MKTFQEIISVAVKIEEEGAEFYRKTGQKSKNPLVAATFEFLANEEDKHVKLFKEYAQNKKNINVQALEHAHISPRDGIKKIFDEKSKQRIQNIASKDSDKVDAYNEGIKIEQKSYQLYKSHINTVDREDEKRLLQYLCDQESSHLEILQGSKDFLENPADWFQKEERWMQT
ncbi:MAG: ferritin family protein [bacterium]